MTHLTQFLTASARSRFGTLQMSAGAAKHLASILNDSGCGHLCGTDDIGPIVATTVAAFLGSEYFSRSEWFRSQRVHLTFTVQIENSSKSGSPYTPVLHLKKVKNGFCVVTPHECTLPPGYHEQRVIEEAKVECGVKCVPPSSTAIPPRRQ